MTKKGINLIGYMNAEMGIGESCRLAAKAINTTDVNFGMINYPKGNPSRKLDFTWNHKKIKNPLYNVNIYHVNAKQMPFVYKYFGNKFFTHRFNIGYWHWELPEFPNEWCKSFNHLQEIWVPSSFTFNSISKKSPIPTVIIPHCIQVDVPADIKRKDFNLPNDKFLFLSMFDTHSVQQRKNPAAVIEAFQSAFHNNDTSVGLVLKVNNSKSTPDQIAKLREKINGQSNIYLIEEILSRGQVNALIAACDSLISLHRSEGFGLTMAEAMYLGKPVIGTNWSANVDFMDQSNSCPVNFELIKVGNDYSVYKSHQVWADPDVEHAAYFMKKVTQEPEWAKSIGASGQETIRNKYSPFRIGKLIKNRMEELSLL